MYSQIKERFEGGDKYFLFHVTKNKEILIAKGSSKTEVKEKLSKKVSDKPDKYKDAKFILLHITFQEPDNKLIFGDLLVNIRHYHLQNNSLSSTSKEVNYVWFTKKFLDENDWDNQYLVKIADVVNKKKVEFNILSMPRYTSIKNL